MADKKISELATATTSIGGYIPILIGGVAKKCLTNAGAGTLDADSVSGCGIGVIGDSGFTGNVTDVITTLTKVGDHKFFTAGDNRPTLGVSDYYSIICIGGGSSVNQTSYLAYSAVGGATRNMYIGRKYSASIIEWAQIWTSGTDGNGGQPPAPKPQGGNASLQGFWTNTGVNTYTTPAASGTYAGIAFKSGAFYSTFAGAANSTDLNTLFSTTGIDGMFAWKIT